MTMAMQAAQQSPSGPKVLRIGLIQGGKIVEERVIRTRETVTVGSSEKNHFVVRADSLGSRFDLFEMSGGEYVLNFTENMRGRVGLGGGVQELDELRKSGGARRADGYHQVKLSEQSRGKVVVGDTTLLFQFVPPPPVQAKPQLPAAVIGGFVAGIDWMFTAFVMFSLMTHFGFVIYLENADWPVEPDIATIPDRVAELIFNEPEPPEPPPSETPTETDEEAEQETEVAEVREPSRNNNQNSNSNNSAPSQTSASSGESQGDTDARLAAEQATAQVENLLIGALGNGAFADVLRDGAATGRSEDLLQQAQGVGVASSAEGNTLRERSGGSELGSGNTTLGGLQSAGGQQVARQQQEGEQVEEARVRGSTRVGGMEDETGAGVFDSSLVVRQLRMRQSAIQRCYERELRNNPTLNGRVVARFTIQPTGSVGGVTATENSTGSPAVATCVTNVVRGLRFSPGPEGGSVTYSFPFVFAVQN
jgi:TonB family protein